MERKDEYEQIWSGVWEDLNGPFELACCSCCLVHSVNVRMHEGRIQIQLIERKGETKRLRKKHGIKVTRT